MADRDADNDDLLRRLGELIAEVEESPARAGVDVSMSDEAIDRVLGRVLDPTTEGEPPRSGSRLVRAVVSSTPAKVRGPRARISPWVCGGLITASVAATLLVLRLGQPGDEPAAPTASSSESRAGDDEAPTNGFGGQMALRGALTTPPSAAEAERVSLPITVSPAQPVRRLTAPRQELPASVERPAKLGTPVATVAGPALSLVPAKKKRSGLLSLDSAPWTNVFLDGKPLGPTPLVRVVLPAGKQLLVLENPALGQSSVYAVEIEEGELVTRFIDWKTTSGDELSLSPLAHPDRRLGL